MMQSATNYDTEKVKVEAEAQAKEEQQDAILADVITQLPAGSPMEQPAPTINASTIPTRSTRSQKPRLRQQAYYLTEEEIKTIKRLSYELDIPKSDLVRKFIDEGIARIEQNNKS